MSQAERVAQSPPEGLAAFQRRRKKDSRESLLSAAAVLFGRSGYSPVSVEDIVQAAGLSRMTFYRHFRGKAEVASMLFDANVGQAEPQLLSIRARNWRDRAVVGQWLCELFALDSANGAMLRVFIQASAVEPEFTAKGHSQIATWIDALGQRIPAFALNQNDPADRRRWLEAWLLIYEILDQSNHAALQSGIADDPLVIDILTDRFCAFTTNGAIA